MAIAVVCKEKRHPRRTLCLGCAIDARVNSLALNKPALWAFEWIGAGHKCAQCGLSLDGPEEDEY